MLRGRESTQSTTGFRPGGPPDADAHPVPVAGAQLIADGAQPVVAGMPPAELHPNSAGVDVQLVVDDDEMVGIPHGRPS